MAGERRPALPLGTAKPSAAFSRGEVPLQARETYLLRIQELPYDRNILPKQYMSAPKSQDFHHKDAPMLTHVVARWDAPLEMALATGETVKIYLERAIPCPLRFRLPLLCRTFARPYRATLVVVDGGVHYCLLPRAPRLAAVPQVASDSPYASGLPVMRPRDLQPPHQLAAALEVIVEESPQQDLAVAALPTPGQQAPP